ncbi:chemotaxis protein CheB [Streptomyces sp. N35]|uniref:chemotaxis protein CheB n=1 Tax=Streptomyces sp. N35 TaxID=2795730 RepID=UPI0018F41A93|nr:chemotaxis protein CheB [Streptomyces sp. N35]
MTADRSCEEAVRDAPFAVAVAASAGGLLALLRLLDGLGTALPVPVLIIQHLHPEHRTLLADILGRRTGRSVKLAEDGERAEPGLVYVAPPDRHLLIRPGGILSLSDSAPVHFLRPCADLLFESLADAYADRAIACVLTGTGQDGATGVAAVKSRGGTVIAQDPETAEFPGMPEAAVGTGAVDFVLPLDDIAAVLRGLVDTKRH